GSLLRRELPTGLRDGDGTGPQGLTPSIVYLLSSIVYQPGRQSSDDPISSPRSGYPAKGSNPPYVRTTLSHSCGDFL
ncbi:hypothetical protein, partial [uncultured Dialister sp.]|uniref:hypothetical protein n=1 Tax=uncultured Dialister sp. TaxID=278064 RepID=UPI0025F3ACC1